MTDMIARLRLEGEAAGMVGAVGQADKAVTKFTSNVSAGAAATGRIDRELGQVAGSAGRAGSGLTAAAAGAQRFEQSAGLARQAGLLLGATLATIGARELVGSLSSAAFAAQGFQTALTAVAGGATGAGEAQGFLRQESARLGLVLRDQVDSFVGLAGATKGTRLEGAQTRDIWLSMVEAGTALNRSSDQQKRGLEAVSQIASKGVVSMEEIRQQLAESIPGAVNIAAMAMGKTTLEFTKLVSQGKLLSEDFLPKFAAQLRKEFGSTLDEAMNTPLGRARRELAETKNALFDLETAAGTSFLTGVTEGLTGLNAALTDDNARQAAKELGQSLGEGLSAAAQATAFLVNNIHAVELGLGALVAVGVGRWMATVVAETQAATIALAAKGVAAGGAAKADMTMTAALQSAALAELRAAEAAQALAIADQEVAATALMAATAFEAEGAASTAAMAAQAELAAAQTATAAASARVAAANVAVAGSTSAMAGAGAIARGAMGSLSAMLGGPLGIALAATGVALWTVGQAMAEDARITQDLQTLTTSYASAMADAEQFLRLAADSSQKFGEANAGAIAATDSLANSTFRLANALAEARRQRLQAVYDEAGTQLRKLDNPSAGVVAGRFFTETIPTAFFRYYAPQAPNEAEKKRQKERERLQGIQTDALGEQIKLVFSDAANTPDAPTRPPAALGAGKGKADKLEDKAKQALDDLVAQKQATMDYIAAVQKGPAAIAEWKAQEAGRQAVERLGLSNRTKLTKSEQDLLATIRQAAVDTERLKQSAERMEAGATMQRQAELDTAALKRREEAIGKGEQALEDLRVSEAGLAAQQQLGIENLDDLKGADLEQAKAAIAAAEAKERQAIATEKAARVQATLDDLDSQIKSQEAYGVALAGGAKALIEYTIAEEIRQEVERTGKTLTDEQVAAIRRKTLALIQMKAANDSAADVRQFEQDVRLAAMSADEREREVRALQLRDQYLRTDTGLSEAEALAKARARAEYEQAAMKRAEAIGQLKDGIRDAFLDTGKLSFDQLGKYAERKLREAIYKAFLEKPIDIVINAVVKGLEESLGAALSKALGQSSGSPFTGTASGKNGGADASNGSAEAMAQLPSSISAAIKAGFQIFASAQIGASLAETVGLKGSQKDPKGQQLLDLAASALGNAIGGPIGGAIATFISHAIGPALFGKESNHGATATFNAGGGFDLSGSKRDSKTSKAVTDAGSALLGLIDQLDGVGIKVAGVIKSIEIGERDPSKIVLGSGEVLHSAKGDAQALLDAAGKALLQHGVYDDPNMKKVVDQMIAANRSFADIAEKLGRYVQAQDFASDAKLALLKFTDPRAAAIQELQAQQKARRDQADDYAKQGFYTDAQLADLKATLTALDSAELADALSKLGDSATDAAKALQQAKPSLREWLDRLTQTIAAPVNPFEQRGLAMAQYERVLEQARAGDSNALGSLTGYAERLLEADRNSTSDAQARLALYNKVTSDIAQLAAPDTVATQAAAIEALNTANSAVTLQASQQIVSAISGEDGVVVAVEAMGNQIATALGRVEAALGGGLDVLGGETGEGLRSLLETARQQASDLAELASAQRATNAYLQKAGARP